MLERFHRYEKRFKSNIEREWPTCGSYGSRIFIPRLIKNNNNLYLPTIKNDKVIKCIYKRFSF